MTARNNNYSIQTGEMLPLGRGDQLKGDWRESAKEAMHSALEKLDKREENKRMKKNELVEKRVAAVTLATDLDTMVKASADTYLAAQSGSMADTLALAVATSEIEKALTPDIMRPLMSLQGKAIGFKTDKVYPEKVVKECAIEALLLGLPMAGNCVNIISGRAYPTKEGFTFKINQLAAEREIQYFKYVVEPPRGHEVRGQSGGGNDIIVAMVPTKATWKQNGREQTLEMVFPCKGDKWASEDAYMGKAERKLKKRVYERMTGLTFAAEVDEDLEDLLGVAEIEEVTEPEAATEAPEETKEPKGKAEPVSDNITVKSLAVIQKHRPEDFAAACESQGIPLKMWKDAPAQLLGDLLKELK